MTLDNRELALLICIAVGVGLLVWKAKAFKQLRTLVRMFFRRPILTVLGLAAGYIAICVWLLSRVGCWEGSNLKTTLLWAGSFALVAVFNFQRIESGKAFARTVFLEAVGINAFLSFLTDNYTFGLLAELVLAATMILLVLVHAVCERDDNLKKTSYVALLLFALLSLLKLGHSIYRLAIDWREYAATHSAGEFVGPILHTGREFAVPILLTLMFLPFLYSIHVYTTYERIIAVFNHTTRNLAPHRHVLRKLIAGFGLDLAGLEKWRRHTGMFPPTTLEQVDESIAEIRKARKREKRPYRVEPTYGWLPNHATVFLVSADLATNDYHRSYDTWTACSRYRDLGNDILPSNIAYYIEGDEFVVSQLKLVLNVNAPDSAEQAYESFFQAVAQLIESAVPGARNGDNTFSLNSDGTPFLLNGYELALARTDWPNGIKGGHELAFTIRIAEPQAA